MNGYAMEFACIWGAGEEGRVSVRESDMVYETLVIDILDKKIICRKLGLVGILNIHHLSFMFLRTTIFVKERNSKDIKRKDTFKNTILTTI